MWTMSTNNSGKCQPRFFWSLSHAQFFRQLDFDISKHGRWWKLQFSLGLNVNMVFNGTVCSAWQPLWRRWERIEWVFALWKCWERLQWCLQIAFTLQNLTTSSTLQVALQRGMGFSDVRRFCTVIPWNFHAKHVNKFSEFVPCEFQEDCKVVQVQQFLMVFHVKTVCKWSECESKQQFEWFCQCACSCSPHHTLTLCWIQDLMWRFSQLQWQALEVQPHWRLELFSEMRRVNRFLTSDVRDVHIHSFRTTDGQSLRVKEKAFFQWQSGTFPLLSFGKLIRGRFGVSSHLEIGQFSNSCTFQWILRGNSVFRNNSLVVSGGHSNGAVSKSSNQLMSHVHGMSWEQVGILSMIFPFAVQMQRTSSMWQQIILWLIGLFEQQWHTTISEVGEVIELCERIFSNGRESSSYCGRWLSTSFDSPFKDRALHFWLWNGSCRTCHKWWRFRFNSNDKWFRWHCNGRYKWCAGDSSWFAQEVLKFQLNSPQSIAIQPRPDHVKIAGVDVFMHFCNQCPWRQHALIYRWASQAANRGCGQGS